MPYYEQDGITLYHGDCREVLPTLASDSVDVVLTDPPFNVGYRYDEHDDRMAPEDYCRWLGGILAACARVTRDGVVYTPGNVNLLNTSAVLATTGLRAVRVLGWHRLEFAGDVWAGGPSNSWEAVVWASKQAKPYFTTIYGNQGRDFLIVPSTRGNPWKALHPCPKPLAVMRWLVTLFCPPGGIVLDPFAGSMTSLLAAKELGRRAIGIEISEAYCEIAAKRLQQSVMALEPVA